MQHKPYVLDDVRSASGKGKPMQTPSTCEITRKVEFDAGHRVPSHHSKCKNVHGHRYTLYATVRGPIQATLGDTNDGMVTDFGDLKTIMMGAVGEKWDHSFLVYKGDREMIAALGVLGPAHRTIVLDCIPTAENLAKLAYDAIAEELTHLPKASFELVRVTIYETPNCSAVYPC